MRENSRLKIAAIVATAALAASACGAASTSSPSAATPAADATATAATEPLFVGIVELQASGQFSAIQIPAITKAMEARGWETTVVDPDGSPAKANDAMVNLIQRGVDVLVVQTFPTDALGTGMAAAADAGIPVFGTGGAEAGSGMAGAIVFNAVKSMNDYMIESLKNEANVELLELTYTAGPPCLARRNGLDALLEANPNIHATSLPFTIPGADAATQAATSGWLESHPETEGVTHAIWVCTSEGAGGTIAAEKQLNRGPYPLYTWDISAPTVQNIADGYVTAVVALPQTLGAEQLAQTIADQQAAGPSWQPKSEDAEFLIVTKDNLDEAKGTY